MRKAMGLLACLFLAGCGGNEPGHLSLALGGKALTFDAQLLAQLSDNREHLVIGGKADGAGLSDSYDIELWALGDEVKPGTYRLPGARLISRHATQQAGGSEVWSALGPDPQASFTLQIDSIDDWGVRGRFHGRLKRLGGEAFVDVTDGRFAAPFILH